MGVGLCLAAYVLCCCVLWNDGCLCACCGYVYVSDVYVCVYLLVFVAVSVNVQPLHLQCGSVCVCALCTSAYIRS